MSQQAAPPAKFSLQPLHAGDRALLAVDRTLRRMGASGFETITLVWLDRRIDANRLGRAIRGLAKEHPHVACRLINATASSAPSWLFLTDIESPLREITLRSPAPQAVLDETARILSSPRDLGACSPIQFYLFHRPDGRDVFALQFNHAVMDHNAVAAMLREIDRLAQPDAPLMMSSSSHHVDPIWTYLKSFSRERRRRAAKAAVELWTTALRSGGVMLGRSSLTCGRLQVLSRCLAADEAASLRERIRGACGLPNLSMTLLGSAFRAIQRLSPGPISRRRVYCAGIGVDLGNSVGRGRLVQNRTSLIPIFGLPADLANREQLANQLARQMRERLRHNADLGVLELAAVFGRRPHQADWVLELLFRYGFSLWYACFGALDAVGETFCDATIDEVFSIGPCWPPMGLTLLVNQFRDRLFLQVTHVAESVPAELAREFLDFVIGDWSK